MKKKDKAKGDGHAGHQAAYMERRRGDGLEWLTQWVPQPAHEAFKTIAKAARKTKIAPGATELAAADGMAAQLGATVPDWAKQSDILLAVWALSLKAARDLTDMHDAKDAAKEAEAKAAAADKAAEAEKTAQAKAAAKADKAAESEKAAAAKAATKAAKVAKADAPAQDAAKPPQLKVLKGPKVPKMAKGKLAVAPPAS